MEAQEIFLKVNLRFLRNRKNLTQEDLAEDLGMTRVKLHAIESGKTANPVIGDVIKIAKYFKLATDTLLTVNLSHLGELKLRELESGNDVFLTGKNIRVLAITVNRNNKENVEYVPIKAKAGYRTGYSDPEYLAALPKFSFPNLPAGGTFRMFPTTGDSMLPIPEGSDILARYVQNWKELKSGSLGIVILKGEQDFVFKKVSMQNEGILLLESFNEVYKPYTASVENVLEIWQFERFVSKDIPERASDLQELKSMILDLKKEIKR